MTFEERLAAKIAAKQEQVNAQHEQSMEKLLENSDFIEAQRVISAKANEIKHLDTLITQVNSITPFKANDGTKYSVRAFSVNESIFGAGMGRVLGLIKASESAFTDEMRMQFEAITGISAVEWNEACNALGKPAYYNKDTKSIDFDRIKLPSPAVLKPLLESISIKLGIKEYVTDTVNTDTIQLWFNIEEAKAKSKVLEATKEAALDTTPFTVTD